jgi:hypothetical protein
MQSPQSRLAVLVAGIAVVVLAFVLLRPSGDEGEAGRRAAQAQTAPAATTAPAPAATTATTPAETAPRTTTTPAEPELPTVRVRQDGSVAGGVQELEFAAGDEIAFRVRSAIAEEVHVHGYDVVRALRAGRTTTFRFQGDLEGIFEVELHGSGEQIAELRVSPS